MKKINVNFYFSVFLFTMIFSFNYSFAQTSTSFPVNIGKGTLTFPYQINFTQSEINFLKSLDDATLQKLVQVAVQTLATNVKNNSTNSQTNLQSSTNQPTTYSNSYSAKTPYYDPNTRQYQSTPVTSANSNPYLSSGSSGGGGGGGSSASAPLGSYQNPYLLSPSQSQNGFGNQQIPQTPIQAFTQGLTQGITGKDLSGVNLDVTNIDESCKENYGIDLNSGSGCTDIEGLTNKVKQDMMVMCTLLKKRIKVNSAHRTPYCNSKVGGAGSSQHISGKAVDVSLSQFNTTDKATFVLKMKQLQYIGVGCYGVGGHTHFDYGSPRRWGSGCDPIVSQIYGN